MIELALMINQLRAAGLVAHRATGARVGIMGGTGSVNNCALVLYGSAFSIYLEVDGKWLARYPGSGQLVQEVACANVEKAVNAIFCAYGLA